MNHAQSKAGRLNFQDQLLFLSIIVACVVQFTYLIIQLCFDELLSVQLWIPVELALGPLLCAFAFSGGKITRRAWFFLISLTAALAVSSVLFWTDFQNDTASHSLSGGWSFFVPTFLFIYTVCAMLNVSGELTNLSLRDELVLLLGILFIVMAAVQMMMFYCEFFLAIDTVVDYRVFFTVLLFASAAATAVYRKRIIKEAIEDGYEPVKYAKSSLSDEQVQQYLELIEDFMVKQNGFKRKDLSVRLLSKELGIPRHAFAQLFNVHLNRGFYQYVAEFRIGYAVEQLQIQPLKFTVESLAEDCGFNSKTSFNKYFKKQKGITPKEFVRLECSKLAKS